MVRPRRCSLPGDRVRGLMGAGRLRGELLDRRREELMEGLLRDDWSWQLLRDAWMDGLLRDEDRPVGQTGQRMREVWKLRLPACAPAGPRTQELIV